MKVFEEDGKKYIEVDGKRFEFDATLTIFVDSKTGAWCAKTRLKSEYVVELLDDALEHFMEDATDPHPDLDIVVYPMPTQDWN